VSRFTHGFPGWSGSFEMSYGTKGPSSDRFVARSSCGRSSRSGRREVEGGVVVGAGTGGGGLDSVRQAEATRSPSFSQGPASGSIPLHNGAIVNSINDRRQFNTELVQSDITPSACLRHSIRFTVNDWVYPTSTTRAPRSQEFGTLMGATHRCIG
jgi:hypothetical protein